MSTVFDIVRALAVGVVIGDMLRRRPHTLLSIAACATLAAGNLVLAIRDFGEAASVFWAALVVMWTANAVLSVNVIRRGEQFEEWP